MKTYLLLISLEYINALEIAKSMRGKNFINPFDATISANEQVKTDEGSDLEEAYTAIYSVEDFVLACNEQTLNLENFYIAEVLISN